MGFLLRLSLVLFSCIYAAIAAPNATKTCKCLSSYHCWSESFTFALLSSEPTRSAIKPEPPASPCYPVDNPSEDCTEIREFWTDGNWRAARIGAVQSPNYETYIFPDGKIIACYLSSTLGVPCRHGSLPYIGVDALTVSDVQLGVKFVHTSNLRLVMKNTGHDYLGRSTARGSFVIWTHNMKKITVYSTFTPTGVPTTETYQSAITLEAGVQWHEAYDAADAADRVLVGGVDNVLELTVVTADGEHRIANSHQNRDLFWALRGGEGGTFGVVTSVTYRSHPNGQIIVGFLTTSIKANTTDSSPVLVKLVSELFHHSSNLTDSGWGGYAFLIPSTPGESLALQLILVAPNATWAQANETFNPFAERVAALAADSGGILNITNEATVPYASYKVWLDQFFTFATGQVGENTILGSRLLPKTSLNLEPHVTQIAEFMSSFPGGVIFHLVAGGAVSKIDADSVGLNPAWRKASIHTVWGDIWPEGTSATEIDAKVALMKQQLQTADKVVPNSGAYFNEASLFEDNFQQVFFGNHYPKLKAIKKQYDPDDLFIVPKGAGSEDWDEQLHCRVQASY